MIILDDYYRNAVSFYDTNPYFYDKNGIFWFWNSGLHCYEIKDETDLLNFFDRELAFYGATITPKVRLIYLEAFKRVGRRGVPIEAKKKWIQFKGKAYDLKGHFHKVDFKYFFTNPIPWDIGELTDTPTMDKLFKEWVGEEWVNTCYEIIAYCCYRGTPIHRIFCLYGSGCNGKSQFLKVVRKFIGANNIASTELDLLCGNNKSRFESFKIYRKLVCEMGETNFGTISQTSIIKKIASGDLIGFEKKGKDSFDEEVYAKLIIASNSLPSSEDTSTGFFRRWIIIKFLNEFKEGKEIYLTIPDKEYNNLAKKVTDILPKLLETGKFTKEGTIEERKNKYIEVSNPILIFINTFCVIGGDKFISSGKLYTAYIQWLTENKHRRVNRKEFNSALANEGFWIERTSKKNEAGEFKSDNWVVGINLKIDNVNCVSNDVFSTLPPYIGADIETLDNLHNLHDSTTKNSYEIKLVSFFQQFPDAITEHRLKEVDIPEDILYKLLEKLNTKGVIFSPRPYEWKLL